jgi:hypothetical protein
VTRRDTAETFKDTIMIKDRAVEVTVIYPNDMNVLNVQELAEKAWRIGEQGNHGRQSDGEGAGVSGSGSV